MTDFRTGGPGACFLRVCEEPPGPSIYDEGTTRPVRPDLHRDSTVAAMEFNFLGGRWV
jgi:hypothetical protein